MTAVMLMSFSGMNKHLKVSHRKVSVRRVLFNYVFSEVVYFVISK